MVLHPITPGKTESPIQPQSAPVSAWEAVERKQRQAADEWWLIAQPDHAALAGDLAAALSSPLFPQLDSNLIHAISLHDSGWSRFDGGVRGTGRELEVSLCDPKLGPDGRPLSFFEMTPAEFLIAWTDSIERSQQAGALGGVIVSQHFCRLAQSRLHSHCDSELDTQMLRRFLDQQRQRQQHLLQHQPYSAEQVSQLTDVLQFCDLLSLYLCCGSAENVAFPQKFNGCSIRLFREGEMARLDPPVLGDGISLGITARRYPLFGAFEISTLPILLS